MDICSLGAVYKPLINPDVRVCKRVGISAAAKNPETGLQKLVSSATYSNKALLAQISHSLIYRDLSSRTDKNGLEAELIKTLLKLTAS